MRHVHTKIMHSTHLMLAAMVYRVSLYSPLASSGTTPSMAASLAEWDGGGGTGEGRSSLFLHTREAWYARYVRGRIYQYAIRGTTRIRDQLRG